MAILRIGYGKDLDHYKTKRYDSENFDISITTEGGDIVEVNTRLHGFAVRLQNIEGTKKTTLIDKDY